MPASTHAPKKKKSLPFVRAEEDHTNNIATDGTISSSKTGPHFGHELNMTLTNKTGRLAHDHNR